MSGPGAEPIQAADPTSRRQTSRQSTTNSGRRSVDTSPVWSAQTTLRT
jgi:hypothetical protein